MTPEINDLGARVGLKWFDYQVETLTAVQASRFPQRECLYYKTGAGKSYTGLACMALWGITQVLVIAPPSTYPAWEKAGAKFGIDVQCMSHAKFRMKDTRVARTQAMIVDEFHLLGGQGGKGWKKMDTLAKHLQAPLVLMSATPNYNDAERVYCIQHVLDPLSCRGGYLEFLYRECETEQDPFSATPKVLGFRNHPDAAAYLAALPGVHYLPDDLVYTINDVPLPREEPAELVRYGYNARRERIIASIIEEKHAIIDLSLIDANLGGIRPHVYDVLADLVGNATTPVLIFSNHSTVAEALDRTLARNGVKTALVHGGTPAKKKAAYLDAFRDGVLDVLVGTASLATGTDGLDKVCDWLIILDDTDDDSLRRQLIGRIMPRGEGGDATTKQVYRMVLQ